jgi:UMF1 family MFS transporter
MRNASSQSKLSVPSISQSNEADDEQSLSDNQTFDMESNHDAPPRYEGEDTRLTSEKELRGFYMYGWAAEVFILIYNASESLSFLLKLPLMFNIHAEM